MVKAIKAQYEVLEFIDDEERYYVVDLKKFKYDCGGWQISGLSCKYAIACILIRLKAFNLLSSIRVPNYTIFQ